MTELYVAMVPRCLSACFALVKDGVVDNQRLVEFPESGKKSFPICGIIVATSMAKQLIV